MRQNIDPSNASEWAAKTYLALIFAHVFENGNGRVARNIYHLIKKEGVPPSEITFGRPSDTEKLCMAVGLQSIRKVFIRHGIACTINELNEGKFGLLSDGIYMSGDMGLLRFLAAYEALKEGGKVGEGCKEINLDNLTEPEKQRCKAIFQELKNERFRAIFDVYSSYQKEIDERLEKSIIGENN